MSLCYRCETRATYLETSEWREGKLTKKGHSPRCECGNITSSKWACYMYKPCKPIAMEKMEGDDRPSFGGALLGARMGASKDQPKLGLDYKVDGNSEMLYWRPYKDIIRDNIKYLENRIKKSVSAKNIKKYEERIKGYKKELKT